VDLAEYLGTYVFENLTALPELHPSEKPVSPVTGQLPDECLAGSAAKSLLEPASNRERELREILRRPSQLGGDQIGVQPKVVVDQDVAEAAEPLEAFAR
jgi:hypothetical protein